MLLHAFLLRGCPYSQSLARVLRPYPHVKKHWVNHESDAYSRYKEKYNHPTYPIVVLQENDEFITVGGYTDFMKYHHQM